MKKIIFRADDLGYSEAVNLGIYKSVHDGVIQNVGLMSNMEFAKHGVDLFVNEQVCLGQHVNISAGFPVTPPHLISSLVNEDGSFKSTKAYATSKEDVVLEEVILEIDAQYHRFVELTGKQPEYFDGHAVMSANFFKALEIVAKKYHLKYSPFPSDLTKSVQIGDTAVRLFGGSNPHATCFECLKKVIENQGCEVGLLIYHPGFLDAYLLEHSSLTYPRVYELEMLCHPNTKQYLVDMNVQLLTFNEL